MEKKISAQVVMKWSVSPDDGSQKQISAQTAAAYKMDEGTILKVKEFFKKNGFEVGAVVANNFSITASKERFEKVFGTKITTNKAHRYLTQPGMDSLLPLNNLTGSIRNLIDLVTFVEPPELQKNDYSF